MGRANRLLSSRMVRGCSDLDPCFDSDYVTDVSESRDLVSENAGGALSHQGESTMSRWFAG